MMYIRFPLSLRQVEDLLHERGIEVSDELRQETGRWLNNRAENSHQPFRRGERTMAKFRSPATLQKFVAIHSSIYTHFNLERHLCNRQYFKLNRTHALAEWRELAAWYTPLANLAG